MPCDSAEARVSNLMGAHESAFGTGDAGTRLVSSPYRICPLGAHVDHQLGLVTGMAIDTGVLLAYTANASEQVRLRSQDFEGEVLFSLTEIPPVVPGNWGNYARGAALALQQHYPLRHGLDGVISGSLPIGGLSSSAAVGVACLLALEDVNGLNVESAENVRLDQFIENQYIGLNNGVLDQSVILLSQEGRLLFLDCESGQHENIALPDGAPGFEIAVVYSGLSRSLVNTGYNQRVAECREAARSLLDHADMGVKGAPVLRQVPEEVFARHVDSLPPVLAKRATHFIEECQRVRRGVEAWRTGDLTTFGILMNQSGSSSIHNYECGSPHLITLFSLLTECRGVYGARFSGAGFRGCCIALVDPDHREGIYEVIEQDYPLAHPDIAGQFSIHFCQSGNGARIL